MTPRHTTPAPVVRVHAKADFTRALDVLWREGGPVIGAPSVAALGAWSIDIDVENDCNEEAGTHTPSRRERVVDMIRNITVDGEEALAVDTAEELGRALLTGRYVVASDAVRAAYGLTDTENSDTEDIAKESDWRDDAWRAEGGN